eukprot:12266297-Alexandrium_andersonii.AAC.1
MTQAARRLGWTMVAMASAGAPAQGAAVGVALAAREPVSLLDVRAIQEEGSQLLLAPAESQMGSCCV